jgi:hypothetical protein
LSEDGVYGEGEMEGMSELEDSDDDTLDQEADAAATLELYVEPSRRRTDVDADSVIYEQSSPWSFESQITGW